MKRITVIFIFNLLASLLIFSVAAFAWSDWKTLKTKHFTIFYKSEYENQAWEVLKTMEHYRPQVEKLTGNKAFHAPIVIEDVGTITNGFCNPTLYKIGLFTYPPSSTLSFTENWWSLVGVHEYTHLLHLTKASKIPKLLTYLFGNFYAPNLWSPGWVAEGITVYSESQLSKYQGRLNDGFFDAYIKARVGDNRFPSLLEATHRPLEFPSGMGIYLYGGEFFSYLATTYGEEKSAQFFEHYGSSTLSLYSPLLPFLGLDRSGKKVYGKTFPALWREWKKYETDRFETYTPEGEKITSHGWYINHPQIYDGKLYYQRSYPVKTGAFSSFGFNKIMERDLTTHKEHTVVSSTSFFTTPLRVHNGNLYYGVGEMKPGYANTTLQTYGYCTLIHRKDLKTGKVEILLEDEIRAFDVLPDGNIIYSVDKKDKFGSTLYLYGQAPKEKKVLFDTEYLINEIVTSKDKTIVSARKDWKNFSLYTLNLDTGEFTPLVGTPYLEGQLSLYNDKLFYVANYEKKYSAYCYDFSSDQVSRLTEKGFASYPAYNEKTGILYFVGLNSKGHDLYKKLVKFKEFQIPDFVPTSSFDFKLKESDVSKGNYSDNLKTLTPKIRFPLASFDKEMSLAGLLFVGGDAVGDFLYSGNVVYDFVKEEPRFYINLVNNFFAPLQSSIEMGNTGQAFLEDKLSFNLDLNYPINRSLTPGLAELRLGSLFNLREDLSRQIVAPYMKLSYQFPRISGSVALRLPLERVRMGSTIDRTGLYVDLRLLYYLPHRQISINLQDIYDPDNPNPVFPKIRGYTKSLDTKFGSVVSLDYSSPLFNIRYGLWNPSIYFEDLCANFFMDACFSAGDRWQFSSGIEFHLETKVLNTISSLPLGLGIRFVFNKDGDFGVEPVLKLGL